MDKIVRRAGSKKNGALRVGLKQKIGIREGKPEQTGAIWHLIPGRR
jgi:hypothetical protein